MGVQLVLDILRIPAAEGLGGSSVTSGGHKNEEGEGRAHLAPKGNLSRLCSSSCDAAPGKAWDQHVISCYRQPDAQRYLQAGCFPSHPLVFFYPQTPSQAG